MAKLRVSKMFKRAISHIFTHPATSLYPYVEPQLPKDSRGRPIFDATLCVGCGLCSKDCPSQAIEMVEFNAYKRPQFRLDRCIFCYQCAETCRRGAIKSSAFFEMATTDKSKLIFRPHLTVTA